MGCVPTSRTIILAPGSTNAQRSATCQKERSQRWSPVSCSSEKGVLAAQYFGGPAGPQDTLNPFHTSTPTSVAEAHQYCSLRLLVAAISQHAATRHSTHSTSASECILHPCATGRTFGETSLITHPGICPPPPELISLFF